MRVLTPDETPMPHDDERNGDQLPAGLLLVISGPSGVGKTTIAHRLLEHFPGHFSVSATTRSKSAQESQGVDYHFLTDAQFDSLIESQALLEYATVYGGDRYGTPRAPVDEALAAGQLVILDIDVQGAIQVRSSMPQACMIFILPPSDEELMRRLRDRGRDEAAAIERRFAEAKREISHAHDCGCYNAFIVNSDLDDTVLNAVSVIRHHVGALPSHSQTGQRG
jgi:guanylate kinase